MTKKQNTNTILNWLRSPKKRKNSEEEIHTPKRQRNHSHEGELNTATQPTNTHSFTLKTYDKPWKMEITNTIEKSTRNIYIKNFDDNQKSIFSDH